MTAEVVAEVVAALAARGANEIAHPGGTLLAHLERVHLKLDTWAARPAVRLAGLCHAFYGTDGFGTALGEVTDRSALRRLVGEEAEALVYFYGGCERDFSYPRLVDGEFRDRFTGTTWHPPAALRRDFAEITAANELDVLSVNDDLRSRYARPMLDLFTSWRPLLSAPAWKSAQREL